MDHDILNDPHAFEQLSEADQLHLLDHGSLPGSTEAPPAPAPDPQGEPSAPQPSADEMQQAAAEQEKRGNPEVPLRHLREQVRQHEQDKAQMAAHMAQMQAAMSDPGFLQQQLQAHQANQPTAPELAIEHPDAIRAIAQQAIAPHLQTIQQLQSIIGQQQHNAKMQQLTQQYGPDAVQHIQQFDQAAPHLRNVDPEFKVLAMRGVAATDPKQAQAQQQQVEAMAQAKAEELVKQRLAAAQGGKQLPATLGGLPASKGNDEQPMDINSMSMDDFSKLSDDQIRKMSKNF